MLTRRDQGGLPQADRSACWYQPVELETCITHEKPRPPADPSSPSFHTSPIIAQRAHFKQTSALFVGFSTLQSGASYPNFCGVCRNQFWLHNIMFHTSTYMSVCMSICMCVLWGACLHCCMFRSRTHNTHIHAHIHAHTTHTPHHNEFST